MSVFTGSCFVAIGNYVASPSSLCIQDDVVLSGFSTNPPTIGEFELLMDTLSSMLCRPEGFYIVHIQVAEVYSTMLDFVSRCIQVLTVKKNECLASKGFYKPPSGRFLNVEQNTAVLLMSLKRVWIIYWNYPPL
ncbi:hypothetical protein Cni_G21150 [Canna indica]|uniref:Uncharacterized protein n=1 Tax=Canna indica TaxID=4628 RepID=A0AAQ3KPE6_9LILI|nr:hypothetical protein Cni_G21150 [Canna indica]